MGNAIQVDHDAVISEPLSFHNVHAQSIEISADHRRARRTEGLRGLCFSHRPILQNELVCLRVSESLSGRQNKGIAFRFGYTAIDPARDNLQSSPDLSTAGYWVKVVNDSVVKRGGAVFFYLSESGEVIYGRKDKEYGVLFSGVRTDVPLWVVIDLAGSASSLEILDGSLGTLKTEASKMTKAAVAKYQSRRNPKLSRSTDALSTSSGDAVRHTSQDDLHSTTNSVPDQRMRRHVSVPGQPPMLTSEELDILEATSATTSVRAVESEATRSSARSARGGDAQPPRDSRRNHRQSSLTGDPGVNSPHGSTFGVEHPSRTTTTNPAVTPETLVTQLSRTDLSQNQTLADRAQPASSHQYQRRAPNVNESMPFHRTTFGRNILLSEDGQMASRVEGEFSNAYVFTEKPMLPDDELVLQIAEIKEAFIGGMTVGLTTTDPTSLRRSMLPDDPRSLLDRPEYWVVHRNVHTRPKVGNELSFHLSKTGELKYYKNGRENGTIMHVDCSLPLWLFIDVYGITQQIKSLGIIRRSNQNANSRTTGNIRPVFRQVANPEPVSRDDVVRSAATEVDPPVTSRGRRGNRRTVNGGHAADGELAVTASADSTSRNTAPVPVVEQSNGTSSSRGVATVTRGVDGTSGEGRSSRPTVLAQLSVPRPQAGTRSASQVISSPISNLPSGLLPRLPPPLIPLPPGSDSTVTNDLVTLNDIVPAASSATVSSSTSNSQKRDNGECAICLENEPDSALYPCGHMCMCYDCAVSVQQQRSALCPMCRQPIIDILRIYRS